MNVTTLNPAPAGAVVDTAQLIQTAQAKLPGLVLDTEQLAKVDGRLQTLSLRALSRGEISQFGAAQGKALDQALAAFLERIQKNESPNLFRLVSSLNESVEQERLPELAERILNGKPRLIDRIAGLFSRKALNKAINRALEETSNLIQMRSQRLSDVISKMQVELQQVATKVEGEVEQLERVKESYRSNFREYAALSVLLAALVAKSEGELAALEAGSETSAFDLNEYRDKLEALRSQALAAEGIATRLPADQLVMKQIQNAGIQTLTEVTTTATQRFASIRSTLISLHSALQVQKLQKLDDANAALDANLQAVRQKTVRDIVQHAADAPGRNRLAQAEQIKAIVNETRELQALVVAARASNERAFGEAKVMFDAARSELAVIGAEIRPDLAPQS
ncbi:hypothetical protein R0381_001099 [Jeongeupia wiesaeckerbachi]|uniref:hypothetical protein n=1 Tax=Jeongeupia wiesaeckerbachi TaxID=3051218 RepID=UPI003D805EBB